MTEGLVSTKGQVVIPKSLRDAFGIRPGSKIRFANENGQLVGHVVPVAAIPSFEALIEQARKLTPPGVVDFGVAVGDEAIDDGWTPPEGAMEMDMQSLIALWNTHARAAKNA